MNKDQVKILIVEDDPIIAEDIHAYMEEFGYKPLQPVDNADSAMKLIRTEQPQLCLLDVHLGGEIDGIQLARMIKAKLNVPVIFLTAFNDRDTLERIKAVSPSGYLVKPVDERNLQTTVEIAIHNFYEKSTETEQAPNESIVKHDSIFVKIKDQLVKVLLDDIVYFEAYDNYAFLYTKTERHLLSASLKQIEEKLPSLQFIRTHRSYIVNLSKIDEIGTNYLKINKMEIPIGKTHREKLMKSIELL